jgi:hypothetical protein
MDENALNVTHGYIKADPVHRRLDENRLDVTFDFAHNHSRSHRATVRPYKALNCCQEPGLYRHFCKSFCKPYPRPSVRVSARLKQKTPRAIRFRTGRPIHPKRFSPPPFYGACTPSTTSALSSRCSHSRFGTCHTSHAPCAASEAYASSPSSSPASSLPNDPSRSSKSSAEVPSAEASSEESS